MEENSSSDSMSIWEAKNNLAYNDPLPPGNPLFVDTGKARGDFSLQRIYRALNVDREGKVQRPPTKQYTIFTGHRGCGKSTELLRMADYLDHPDRYCVIHLDCLKKLDINNLKYSDVLLALAAALLARLGQEGISLDQVFLTRLEDWFRERVEVHAELKELAAEVRTGAKAKTGLPWLGELYAELTSKINTGSTHRDELRRVVRNNFSQFAEAFNNLIAAGEEEIGRVGKGCRILFSVDGVDRLNGEDSRQFFVEDVHQLTQIRGLFVYCAPIHLLRDMQINGSFSQTFRLPMLKTRSRDNERVPRNCKVMRDLALRRVPKHLFDDLTTLDHLVQYSGGHPRELIRLLNLAINFSEMDRIDREAAEKAVKQAANEYRRLISNEEYARLVQIDLHPDAPDDFTDDQTSTMLSDLVLLEYEDDDGNYFWKSHPVISTLPGYQKARQAIG